MSTTRGLNPQSLQLSRSADVFLKLLPSHITVVMSHRGVIDRTLYEGNMFLHNCVGVGRKGPFRVGKKGPFLDGKKGPYEGNPGLYMVV